MLTEVLVQKLLKNLTDMHVSPPPQYNPTNASAAWFYDLASSFPELTLLLQTLNSQPPQTKDLHHYPVSQQVMEPMYPYQ